MTAPWNREFSNEPAVSGTLHSPSSDPEAAIVLTHGAGGDRDSPLLIQLCDQFARQGWAALRCDLPYRQRRPKGPPSPSSAAKDRLGLGRAVESLRELSPTVFLGGSSYGGRQASMLAAEHPEIASGLLLLSYPLHPPGKADQQRTHHFPQIQTPTLFAHGSKDSFGSVGEMREALQLIPAPADLVVFEGATHGLAGKRAGKTKIEQMADEIVAEARRFFGGSASPK